VSYQWRRKHVRTPTKKKKPPAEREEVHVLSFQLYIVINEKKKKLKTGAERGAGKTERKKN